MLDNTQADKLRQDLDISTTLMGHDLTFKTTWGLFSPREIDEGTELLLRHLDVQPDYDCFDLGCGYGPIGVSLAKSAPQGQTLMVDKDFLAVEYANKNAALNGLTNARAQLSNGFAQVDKSLRFDLVTSNIPAKVGKELMSLFLYDAYQHLKPGGCIYVVTINGLRQYMKREFEATFGNYDKVKQGKNYTISMAQKQP